MQNKNSGRGEDMEKEIILKFLKGEMPFDEFVKLLDDNMYAYIESQYQQVLQNEALQARFKSLCYYWNFDRDPNYKKHLEICIHGRDLFGNKLSLHSALYYLFKTFDDTIEFYDRYKYNFDIFLTCIPQYLLSGETCVLFEPLIESIPRELPKAKKKQIIKDFINETFDLSKKPYWAQESEWPVRNGKPCRYIDKKREGEKVTYYFETIDTKEIVEIEQYY